MDFIFFRDTHWKRKVIRTTSLYSRPTESWVGGEVPFPIFSSQATFVLCRFVLICLSLHQINKQSELPLASTTIFICNVEVRDIF